MTDYICMKCQYIGKPKKKKRGSGKLEFYGWLSFPLGLPYTIWRMTGKKNVCRHCGSDVLAPLDSPVGKRLVEKMEQDLAELKSMPQNIRPGVSVLDKADEEPKAPEAPKPPPKKKEIKPEKPTARYEPAPQDPDDW